MIQTKTLPEPSSPSPDVFSIRARNVMGTQELPLEVDRGLPAGDLTRSIVDLMALPEDVVWDLRDDRSCAFLDESRSIGDQVETGARLTVTPKTHLG